MGILYGLYSGPRPALHIPDTTDYIRLESPDRSGVSFFKMVSMNLRCDMLSPNKTTGSLCLDVKSL